MSNLYLFPNGRIGALEKDLLNTRTWQMLLSASDATEASRLMADTWYGRFPGLTTGAFEAVFDAALAATEQELTELAEDPGLVRGILHRRDSRNARYLWKAALCGAEGMEPALEKPGLIEHSVLSRALFEEEERSLLPPVVAEAAAELASLREPSPLAVDGILDRMAVKLELSELPSIDPDLGRYLEARVDIGNLITCLRFVVSGRRGEISASILSEGGSISADGLAGASVAGTLPELVSESRDLERLVPFVREVVTSRSFLELERESERILLDMLDACSFELFGPAPLAAFLLKREMEMSHLRILLSAKAAGLDKMRLQKRLPRG